VLSNDLLGYYRQISQKCLTIVDVETTGYKPDNSRVIEVSVIQASLADGIQQQRTSLINPQVLVPAQITRFTGISQAMVDTAPMATEVWQEFFSWLNVGVLTAHNLSFDYPFLQAEYRKMGVTYTRSPNEQLCTVILSRLMLADLPSRSLPDLVRHFGFSVGRSHRAEADTLACWLLAEKLLTEIQTEADEVLLARFAREWLPLREAAAILGCSQKVAQKKLEQSGVSARPSRRSGTLMYQRGDVESVFWQEQGRQLPCL
jgi:DNA polymerase III subunit epsilon